MSPLALSLNAFKKMIGEAPEVHFYPGDRIRMMRSPFAKMLGREYEVIQHDENGTLTCRSYKGAMQFSLYSYQVQLVHRPLLNKFRGLFAALAV